MLHAPVPGLLAAREAEFAEQQVADLLGAAEIERPPGDLLRPRLQIDHAQREVVAEVAQGVRIDADAVAFHLRQHRREMAFERLVNREQAFAGEPGLQQVVQPQGDIGVLGGVAGRRVEGDVLETLLRLAGAGHLFEADRLVAEPLGRQFVHAVAVQAGLQNIGDQHGVLDGRHHDPVARQDGEVVLGVLRDLEHRRIFKQRLEPGDDFVERDLVQRRGFLQRQPLRLAMADRNVTGLARRDGQGHTAQTGVRRGKGVGLGVESDDPHGPRPGDPGVESRQVADADIGLDVDRRDRRGFGRLDLRLDPRLLGDAPRERAELHRLQEVGEHLRFRLAHLQRVQRRGHRRVAVQLHQHPRQPDLVGEVDQGLTPLVLLDLAGAGEKRLQVTILVDQGRGRLDPDARRARHVVHRVAAQRLDINHLVRSDAELLDDLIVADLEVLHGVEHRDLGSDQLHQVLVGRHDHHLAAGVAGMAAIGGDDIVRLVAGQLQARHAERRRRLAHQGELRRQVRRSRRAVRLVVLVEIVAERLFGMVEHHGEMGRAVGVGLHLHQQLPQHVAEALHGADRQAVRLARQRGQGVVGAEDEAGAVHQIEPGVRPILGGGARDVVDGREFGFEGVGHGGRIGPSTIPVTRLEGLSVRCPACHHRPTNAREGDSCCRPSLSPR